VTLPKSLQRTPRQIRIIGGVWKRTPLAVPDVSGLRPSPDRVRETLFNWLQHLCRDFAEISALDLFAGTGALGFEAASRGARAVTLVESNPVALDGMRATRERLGARQVEIIAGDALAVASRLEPRSFDLVFVDPPFDAGIQDLTLGTARRLLTTDGLLYLEAPKPLEDESAHRHGFIVVRRARAGNVAFHLLQPASA